MNADMDFSDNTGPVENDTPVGEYANFGESAQNQAPSSEDQPNASGDNPKWAPLLEKIPSPFHGELKGYLSERDRDVNSRFEEIHQQYAPYKTFREQNIDPNMLMGSYQVAQQMRQNPVAFYNQFKEALMQQGLLEREAAQVAQQQVQNAQQPNAEGEDDPYLSQIAELKESIQQRDQQLAQFFQAQQEEQMQARMVEEETTRIENDFQAIEQRVGTLSGHLRSQIIEKAMIMGQQQGRYVSIPEAAQEVFAFIQAARSTARPAPNTIPAGGSNAHVPAKDPAEMTQEERWAFAQQFRPQG